MYEDWLSNYRPNRLSNYVSRLSNYVSRLSKYEAHSSATTQVDSATTLIDSATTTGHDSATMMDRASQIGAQWHLLMQHTKIWCSVLRYAIYIIAVRMACIPYQTWTDKSAVSRFLFPRTKLGVITWNVTATRKATSCGIIPPNRCRVRRYTSFAWAYMHAEGRGRRQ